MLSITVVIFRKKLSSDTELLRSDTEILPWKVLEKYH